MTRLAMRATVVDGVLAVAFGWVGWVGAHLLWATPEPGPRGHGGGPWERGERPFVTWVEASTLSQVALLGVVGGVAVRRRWPRLAYGLVVLGLVGYRAGGAGVGPVFLALGFAVFAMAVVHPVRRWAPLLLGLLPIALAGHWRDQAFGLLDPGLYAELLSGLTVAVLPVMFALLHRARRDTERRQREQDRQRYADEERLRIAREVHDVVGHSLSVITMQAGVALHLLEKRQAESAHPDPQLTASMEAIRQTSKDALTELRTTLGVFRDPDGRAPHGIRPGLARLDELVGALVAAGRAVRVVDETDRRPLPSAVDEAAFRIVQEALTNVVRHTGAGAVVTLTRSGEALVVEVTDDGPATVAPLAGNGLLGMTERALAVGGRVEVATVAPHGLQVRAVLPAPAEVVS